MHFTRQLAVFVKAGIPITEALDHDRRRDRPTSRCGARSARWSTTSATADCSRRRPRSTRGVPELLHRHPPGRRADRSARRDARQPRRLPRARDGDPVEGRRRAVVPDASSWCWRCSPSMVLAGYVLPQFKPLFEELDADLPLPTRMMLFVARFFSDLWYITAIGFAAVHRHRDVRCPSTRRARSSGNGSSLKIPIIRRHHRVRDPRALLPDARRDARGRRAAAVGDGDHHRGRRPTSSTASSSTSPASRCSRVRGFAQPLTDTGLFPGAASRCSRSARRPARSTSSSRSPAEYFNRELESRIKKFTTMFEPIMIVFVGVIVGFVAIALVSAMYGVLGGVKEQDA